MTSSKALSKVAPIRIFAVPMMEKTKSANYFCLNFIAQIQLHLSNQNILLENNKHEIQFCVGSKVNKKSPNRLKEGEDDIKHLIIIKIYHYQQNILLSLKYLIISKTLGGITRLGAKSWISATCHTQGSFLSNDNSDEKI